MVRLKPFEGSDSSTKSVLHEADGGVWGGKPGQMPMSNQAGIGEQLKSLMQFEALAYDHQIFT